MHNFLVAGGESKGWGDHAKGLVYFLLLLVDQSQVYVAVHPLLVDVKSYEFMLVRAIVVFKILKALL